MMFYKDRLRWSLEELASREQQEQFWLGRVPGMMSTFEEAWAGAFDDSGLWAVYDEQEFLEEYGGDVVRLIELLRSLLKKVPLNVHPSEIIPLPVLEEIRKVSQQLLQSALFIE